MIVIKINNILAKRPRVKYLGRRPHRAALILSNLLSVPIKTLSRNRSIIEALDIIIITIIATRKTYIYTIIASVLFLTKH